MRKILMALALVAVAAAATSYAKAPSYYECVQIGWTDPSTGISYPYAICREVYFGL